MANELQPDAITLDIQLPVIDGLSVFEHLKRNPRTRHIPVHVITVVGKSEGCARRVRLPRKPVNKETLDEPSRAWRATSIGRCESSSGRRSAIPASGSARRAARRGERRPVSAVGTVAEALSAVDRRQVDCLVLGLTPEDHEAGLAVR